MSKKPLLVRSHLEFVREGWVRFLHDRTAPRKGHRVHDEGVLIRKATEH